MIDGEGFEDSVKKLTTQIGHLTDPQAGPARFVRSLHNQWRASGGRSAGKPRHSDRYLEEQLKAQGSPVRSLTPKLVGKTKIAPADGESLVRFFLSHWPHPGATEEDIDYKPVLSATEIDAIASFIASRLADRSGEGVPAVMTQTDDAEQTLPGESTTELFSKYFKESDALITVSPEQTFVAAAPKTELIGFRNLMDLLLDIERRDRKRRVLIWVLDLGTPNLEDESTRKKYINVQQLIIRFKALIHFNDARSEERLTWLRSRAAIVLLDTHGDWDEIRGKRPDFSSQHATLSNVNPDWMKNANFRALYGSELNNVQQRVIALFFNASANWQSAPEVNSDLRYFGFSSFKNPRNEQVPRGLELPPLPLRYDDAFRTICAAAANLLELSIPAPDGFDVDGEEAKRQLSYLGFRVLTIDGLLENY